MELSDLSILTMNAELIIESWTHFLNNRPRVDLTKCKIGQKLLSNKGEIMTFMGESENTEFPYKILYPHGSFGTRTKEGWAYKCKPLPTDSDIVYIFD